MYESRLKDNAMNFQLPWDSNTAKGFVVGTASLAIMLFLFSSVHLDEPRERNIRLNSVPLVLLNFGEGDGTGMSKGNLQEEGIANKAPNRTNILEDAQIATETVVKKDRITVEIEESSNVKPVDVVSTDTKNKDRDTLKGNSNKNLGIADAGTSGTGLGNIGSGRGAGNGFGDIEWGGGGNRVVLYKTLPKFPDGVNTSAQIKIRFTVLPDGTVGQIVPLQKADPRLERAAIDALRKWRFNALNSDVTMVGTIPLTFVLK